MKGIIHMRSMAAVSRAEHLPSHDTARSPAAGHAAKRGRSWWSALLVAAPIIVLAVMAWQHRWVSDDGYINLRVIDNIFTGHGPVYNAGERVEVGTSTLWLAVLAVGHAVVPAVPLGWLAVVVGIALTIIGTAAGATGAAMLAGATDRGRLLLPAGLLVVAAVPPFWDFASSGLETGLTFAWLGLSFLLVVRRYLPGRSPVARAASRRTAGWSVGTAVIIGLGPLVRPDLGLIAAPLLLALLVVSKTGWRRWLAMVGAAAALPLGYEVFRAGYYASLVPNTAIAKDAAGSAWSHGAIYLRDFTGTYTLLLPLVALVLLAWLPAAVARWRQRDPAGASVLAAPVVGGLMHAGYVVRLGGDFMHARLLLPATLAVLLPVLVVGVPAARGMAGALSALAVAIALPWAVFVGTSVRVAYPAMGPYGIANERGWYRSAAGRDHPITLADYADFSLAKDGQMLRSRAAAGQRLLLSPDRNQSWPSASGYGLVAIHTNIGILGTSAGPGVHIADSLSLAEPVGARLLLPGVPEARVGHAKVMPMLWMVARYAAPSPADPPPVTTARTALGCGALRELSTAITAPMSVSRFARNLVAAPHLMRLKVPVDPTEARASFCGG